MSLKTSLHGTNTVVAMPTRSRIRESLIKQARATRIQTVIRITTLDQIELFITLAGYNDEIACAVEDLDISLSPHIGYPAHLLRHLLHLSSNIETLALHLPLSSPPTILHGLRFDRLTTFDTHLPHHFLVSFLSAHPTIISLTLRACGSRTNCPLHDLDLGRISELQCPARCFTGIACGQVVTATVNLTRMASLAAMAINSLSMSPLWCLTIDFFSDDYDILARIASAVPNLRKLKLVERLRIQRRFHHTRRPWNDVRAWHLTLLRLPRLEELLLRTPLTIATAHRSDNAVVSAWANGVGPRFTYHPSLFHIGVLQGSGVGDGQRLSHWFKAGATWESVSSALVGPTHSFIV